MPVARKAPITRPSSAMPVFLNAKISCMVMTSCSMPVISDTEVTLRVPSDMRLIWMTRLTADAICWRTALSGMFRSAIATIVSRRCSASRGVFAWMVVETAVVAGVHGLEHVQRFLAADLADDDAIGAHTQSVDDELTLPDRALAFDVRRPRLEAHHVRLLQLQLRRVFDRDDALAAGDEAREDVEQRRLAGAGAARDDDVHARGDAALEEAQHRRGERLTRDQILGAEPVGAETANRHRRAVERQRRDDDVDAGAVLQARVDHRAWTRRCAGRRR